MEFIDAFQLLTPISNCLTTRRQIEEIGDPAALYSALMDLILRLASQGLIHGDYNEFNILVYEDGRPILIDFPQMLSIDHPNAREYFERDVACIKTFFLRKFRFEADDAPKWEDVKREGKLDFEVEASGYGGKLEKEMEWYHREISVVMDNERNGQDEDGDMEEDEGEDNEEDEQLEDDDEEMVTN
jgi:RIO kinase 2